MFEEFKEECEDWISKEDGIATLACGTLEYDLCKNGTDPKSIMDYYNLRFCMEANCEKFRNLNKKE